MKLSFRKLRWKLARRLGFNKAKQIDFLSDFAEMLPYVGAPANILDHIAKHAQNKWRKEAAKRMMVPLVSGKPLSEGMVGLFDSVFIEAVRIGEEKSTLESTLNGVIEKMRSQTNAFSDALKPLIYPSIVLIVSMMGVISLDGTLYQVAVKAAKSPGALPVEMKDLHASAVLIKTGAPLLVLSFIAVVVWFTWASANLVGPMRNKLDRFVPFSTYKLYLGSRFMQIYGILKSAGETESAIFKTMSRGASPYMRSHLRRMQQRIDAGTESVAAVIDTGLISKEEIDRFSLLGGTKGFSAALDVSATKVANATLNNLTKVAKLASYVLLIAGAVLIVKIATAVFSLGQITGV